ncbi:MAG: hypothetical protein ACK4TH_11985, partial [Tepidimonas sp.]
GAGKRLITGESLFTTVCINIQRQDKDRLEASLARLRGVYSDNLLDVVRWCMALDPLSRPQSVFALQRELAREESPEPTPPRWWDRVRARLGLAGDDGREAASHHSQRSSFLEPP